MSTHADDPTRRTEKRSLSDPSPAQQTVLVTGSTDGIGREVVRQLLEQGVGMVIVHARNEQRGEPVLEDLHRQYPQARIELVVGDFSSLAEVVALTQEVERTYQHLSVLVNNAGVGTGTPRIRTSDGFDLTLQVNYLAPFLLTRILQDRLAQSAPARIVNVSSAGQSMAEGIHFDNLNLTQRPYPQTEAYCQSKLAVVMWTYDLADTFRRQGVTVNCLHPGTFVDTKMVRQGMAGSPQMSVHEGAKPVVRLALADDVSTITGQYFDRFHQARSADSAYDEHTRRHLRETTEHLLAAYLPGEKRAETPV
jgi:NAD(P)-dependent dehydrogenase (short-subunit alcohol dehydrogenase family)